MSLAELSVGTEDVADPAISVRVLGKPAEWTTWFISQNLTDRWGNLNDHNAARKPLGPLLADTLLLEDLRAQMWDEVTFVVRKDGRWGILYEVEFHSRTSESWLLEDSPHELQELPEHSTVINDVDALLRRIEPRFPGVQFCIPEEEQIPEGRVAAWAFVPLGHLSTEVEREGLGRALLRQ